MSEVAGTQVVSAQKPKGKPARKPDHRKPVPSGIEVIVLNEKYLYDRICVVTKHAPQVEVALSQISANNAAFSDVSLQHVHARVQADKIVRAVRVKNKVLLLSGHKVVMDAMRDGIEKLSIRMASLNFLERCVVPPKVLNAAELAQRLSKEKPASIRVVTPAKPQ